MRTCFSRYFAGFCFSLRNHGKFFRRGNVQNMQASIVAECQIYGFLRAGYASLATAKTRMHGYRQIFRAIFTDECRLAGIYYALLLRMHRYQSARTAGKEFFQHVVAIHKHITRRSPHE